MYREKLLLILFLFCGALIGCSQIATSETSNRSGLRATEAEGMTGALSITQWKWAATLIDNRRSLDIVQFLDQTHGWAASKEGSLYWTSDGGKVWNKQRVKIPTGFYISSMFFASPSLGWIALRNNPSDILNVKARASWIMCTKDGGENWDFQFHGKALDINRIRFVNGQEGWAVGGQYIIKGTLQSNYLILHTDDQGKHWNDVSDTLGHTLSKSTQTGYVVDVYVNELGRASLLTIEGQIVNTGDNGQSWDLIGAMQDIPPQDVMMRILAFGSVHYIIGGTFSIEGVWGLAARLQDNSLVKKRSSGMFFKDAVLLSENDLLACGSVSTRGESGPDTNKKAGAVFYSSDGGQSWTIVYRSGEAETINALTAIDSKHVWAVGENGLVLRLEPPL